jgi:hypothetical protein
MVFGKWDYLKPILENEIYRLKSLAGGLFMDNIQIANITKFPIYELMTYLNIKYQNNFEQISEEDLANKISYWFFTTLLVPTKFGRTQKKSGIEINLWKKVLNGHPDIKKWYYNYVNEAIDFFEKKFTEIKKFEKI